MSVRKTLHQLATSRGTKRGIAPYWRKYRAGKEKCVNCPLHACCLELAWNDKRALYFHGYFCKDKEGFIRVFFTLEQGTFGAWRRKIVPFEEITKDVKWAREADEKFRGAKALLVKG